MKEQRAKLMKKKSEGGRGRPQANIFWKAKKNFEKIIHKQQRPKLMKKQMERGTWVPLGKYILESKKKILEKLYLFLSIFIKNMKQK